MIKIITTKGLSINLNQKESGLSDKMWHKLNSMGEINLNQKPKGVSEKTMLILAERALAKALWWVNGVAKENAELVVKEKEGMVDPVSFLEMIRFPRDRVSDTTLGEVTVWKAQDGSYIIRVRKDYYFKNRVRMQRFMAFFKEVIAWNMKEEYGTRFVMDGLLMYPKPKSVDGGGMPHY